MGLVLIGFQVCLFVSLLYSYTGSNFLVPLAEKIYDFNSLQSDCFLQFGGSQVAIFHYSFTQNFYGFNLWKQDCSYKTFLNRMSPLLDVLDVFKLFHLVANLISVKWQPETKLYGEETHGSLQLLSSLRHSSHTHQGAGLSEYFWFWCWYFLEILLVLSL